MKTICVFCGSKVGEKPAYRNDAAELGRLMVERGYELVYGGGSVGLMGVVADAVLAAGGRVTGVIPRMLAVKELLHTSVTEIQVVEDMHTRKMSMATQADAFIALPGGYGTFEELFEIITWAQLGIHQKPIGLLNTEGYYDPLVKLVEHSIADGFIQQRHRDLILVESTPAALLDRLPNHRLPEVHRWLGPEEV